MKNLYSAASLLLLLCATFTAAQETVVIDGIQLDVLIAENTGDNPVRVIDSPDGQYGVFLLTSTVRAAPADGVVNGGYHSKVGEIYRVVSGTGTFVTNGELLDPVVVDEDSMRYSRAGPGESGALRNAELVPYGPGSIFIVPPGVPHNAGHAVFTKSVFIVYRFDPERVLPQH
jgi:mannose-6-phosphate isomerase-like protein (cupin superfamily)